MILNVFDMSKLSNALYSLLFSYSQNTYVPDTRPSMSLLKIVALAAEAPEIIIFNF